MRPVSLFELFDARPGGAGGRSRGEGPRKLAPLARVAESVLCAVMNHRLVRVLVCALACAVAPTIVRAARSSTSVRGAAQAAAQASIANGGGSAASGAAATRGPFVLERGADRQSIRYPRDEELSYRVSISLGVLGSPTVGTVTMTSKVEPFFKGGVVRPEAIEEAPLEQAFVSARAEGSYAVYSVVETISTRVLPQLYPRILHKTVQTGTENRQRELSIGRIGEGTSSSYRSDGHCRGCEDRAHFVKSTWPWQDAHHCKSCKRGEHRVWREPRKKDIPDGSIDMVSAVMLARTVVQQGKPSAHFTLLDREKLWDVELSRGRRGRRKTPAGEFDVVEVLLATRVPESEGGDSEEFVGLFGLHGSISIWMHPESGVPVAITGLVPAGPINLDVVIELESYRGTPDSFHKVVKARDGR